MSASRITLYALRELHLPVLLPVYEALKALHSTFEIGFTAPEFVPNQGERAEEGLRPETLQDLERQGIPFWGNPVEPHYAAVVTADACYDRVEGWGPVICVGHGTISKNIYFIDQNSCLRENYASVLCVPGPWYTQSFGNWLHTRIEPTGFPKLDTMARDFDYFKLLTWAKTGLDRTKTTILFAPTYNPEFTGMEAFYRYWTDLDPSKFQILFKLHGAADPYWRDQYRTLAAQNSHMHYVEDPDLSPWMHLADLMVSDVSSAWVEWILCDKPLVLFDNPRMTQTSLYNPNAVEFKIRDAGVRIASGAELVPSIHQSILQDHKSPRRRAIAAELFPALDGLNSHRAASISLEIAQNPLRASEPLVSEIAVLIPMEVHDYAKLAANLLRRERPGPIYSPVPHPKLSALGLHIQSLPDQLPLPLAILNGEHLLAWNWDRIWSLARKFQNPPYALSGPMLAESPQSGLQSLHRLLNQRLEGTPGMLQMYSKYYLAHLATEVHDLQIDGMIFGPEAAPGLEGASMGVQGPQLGRRAQMNLLQLEDPSRRQDLIRGLMAQGLKVGVYCGLFAV
jgi:hypothetical protein